MPACLFVNYVSSDFFESVGPRGRTPVPSSRKPHICDGTCHVSCYIEERHLGAGQLPSQVVRELLQE